MPNAESLSYLKRPGQRWEWLRVERLLGEYRIPEAKAEGIVQEELGRRRWAEATLAARRKGDPEKVKVVQQLRAETTVTLGWIAERLQMGTKTHLAHLLYWQGRGG